MAHPFTTLYSILNKIILPNAYSYRTTKTETYRLKRETNKGGKGDTLDSASIRSAGAEDPGCSEHDLEPQIHIINDLSKEKFKAQCSQPMRVG